MYTRVQNLEYNLQGVEVDEQVSLGETLYTNQTYWESQNMVVNFFLRLWC
jgi:hypothetical protein